MANRKRESERRKREADVNKRERGCDGQRTEKKLIPRLGAGKVLRLRRR
jgi:hypothetical protein